jgi:hypothetical protein
MVFTTTHVWQEQVPSCYPLHLIDLGIDYVIGLLPEIKPVENEKLHFFHSHCAEIETATITVNDLLNIFYFLGINHFPENLTNVHYFNKI